MLENLPGCFGGSMVVASSVGLSVQLIRYLGLTAVAALFGWVLEVCGGVVVNDVVRRVEVANSISLVVACGGAALVVVVAVVWRMAVVVMGGGAVVVVVGGATLPFVSPAEDQSSGGEVRIWAGRAEPVSEVCPLPAVAAGSASRLDSTLSFSLALTVCFRLRNRSSNTKSTDPSPLTTSSTAATAAAQRRHGRQSVSIVI